MIAVLGAIATMFSSCSDAENQGMVPDSIYFVNNNSVPVTLYNTGNKSTYNLALYRAGKFGESATAVVGVMSQSEVDEYNFNEGQNYEILPSQYYSIKETTVSFGKGVADVNAFIPIEFETEALNNFLELNPDVKYAVPMKIVSASLPIQEKLSISMIVPKVNEANVYMVTVGEKKYTYGSDDDVSSIEMKLPIAIDFNTTTDINCIIGVDEEALSIYNDENDTFYSLLPTELYSLDTEVTIKADTKEAFSSLSINGASLPEGNYILPIYLKSVSQYSVQKEDNLYLLAISIQSPVLPTAGMKFIYASTWASAGEGTNGGADKLLDGDPATYWHSQWTGGTPENPTSPPLPHNLILDLGKDYTVTGVDLARRLSNSATEGGILYFTEDDAATLVAQGKVSEINWTKAGAFYMETVDGYQSFMTYTAKTRYIMISITDSRNGVVTSLSMVAVRGF